MTTTVRPEICTAPAGAGHHPPRRTWANLLIRRESGGLLLVVLTVVVGTQISTAFWRPHFLLFDTGQYVEIGLLALTMTVLVVMGEIDLSVGSAAALSGSVLADLYSKSVPIGLAVLVAIAIGALLGVVNGLLVTRLKLPSLVVTLGTMAAFRGFAEVVLGPRSVVLPDSATGFDKYGFTGTQVDLPVELVAFLGVAVLFTVLLHRTTFGQLAFTIGANRNAARFSGVRVDRLRLIAFTMSGVMAGAVGVLYASRLGSMTYQGATGYELLAVTVVVLGGTDIFGGRGSIPATVIALATVMAIREVMFIEAINGSTQNAVVGGLLILSVLLPVAVRRLAAFSLSRRAAPRSSGTPTRGMHRSTSPHQSEGATQG
jgi:rhamnose transport system permease protein